MRYSPYVILIIFVFFSLSAALALEKPQVKIVSEGNYRFVISNGLPETHGQFPNPGNPNTIRAQTYRFRVPLNPQLAAQLIPVGHMDFGVAVDGVPFDPNSNEWWERKPSSGWLYQAMSKFVKLGLDQNHAHVQPSGAYHYHALPTGLFKRLTKGQKSSQMILLGYAADGFPIYGPYGPQDPKDSKSSVIKLKSSYRLKPGTRPTGPRGKYDGRFDQDYEYVAGLGNLDQCNGRNGPTPEYPQGIYQYFVTRDYPYIPRCFKGTPDPSFQKKRPHRHRPPGPPPPR